MVDTTQIKIILARVWRGSAWLRSAYRADWFVALLLSVFMFYAAQSGPLERLNGAAYDFGVAMSPELPPNSSIEIIAIDENSLSHLGPWPWSRDLVADVLYKLADAGAERTALMLDLHRAQHISAFKYIRDLRESYDLGLMSRRTPVRYKQLETLLERAEQRLASDEYLAKQIRASGKVLVGMRYSEREIDVENAGAQNTNVRVSCPPESMRPSEVGFFQPGIFERPAVVSAQTLLLPIVPVAESALAIGYMQDYGRMSRGQRWLPLAIHDDQGCVPSLDLLLAGAMLGLDAQSIKLDDQGVPVFRQAGLNGGDSFYRVFPFFYQRRDGSEPFPVTSFHDVWAGKVDAQRFKDKFVLIGLTDPALSPPVQSPLGPLAPVQVLAHTISGLRDGYGFGEPAWSVNAQAILLLLVGMFLALAVPRLSFATGVLVTSALVLLLGNASLFLMVLQHTWVPPMAPMALLIGGFGLMSVRRYVDEKIAYVWRQYHRANVLLAQSLHAQGRLDEAYERFLKASVDEDVGGSLYSLSLDYERKRHYGKAEAVLKYLHQHAPKFRDVAERLDRIRETRLMRVPMAGAGSMDKTMILDDERMEKPNVGRYQIEKAIGRGAMGAVYLGTDPSIGRPVALKLIDLAHEFGQQDVEEVRASIYREAETAGRLDHPNIITVYDVGEEDDIAYIAMEYFPGEPLDAYTRKEKLLPIAKVLEISGQVADALHYAHTHGVIHRDIKPGNIMYDAANEQVKVADFGIARIMDPSRTRTGVLLGSPSYMSPEQLAGKELDGRSDLYSLGVTIYQLLTGELPFASDSLASLMYKIANEAPPAILSLREDLPACCAEVVERVLRKEAPHRYDHGSEMAETLRSCLHNYLHAATRQIS